MTELQLSYTGLKDQAKVIKNNKEELNTLASIFKCTTDTLQIIFTCIVFVENNSVVILRCGSITEAIHTDCCVLKNNLASL